MCDKEKVPVSPVSS